MLVSITLAFELGFVFALTSMLHAAQEQLAADSETRAVLSHLYKLSGLMQGSAISMVNSFVDTKQSRDAEFAEIIRQIPLEIEAMKPLVKHHPSQMTTLNELDAVCVSGIAYIKEARQSFLDYDMSRHFEVLMKLKRVSDTATDQIERLTRNFNDLQEQARMEHNQSRQLLRTVLLGGMAINVVLALALVTLFARGVARRLRILKENTVRLAIGQTLHPVSRGEDEIARVDQAFHAMAQTLTAMQEKERAVIENALDVIFSLDANGKFTAVNDAALCAWGFSTDTLIGARYTENVLPAQRQETLAALEQAMKSATASNIESSFRRKDGALIELLISARWSHTERNLFCVAHDITERKHVEKMLQASDNRLRAIMDNLPVGVLIVDEALIVRSVNPSAQEMFRSTAGKLCGRRCDALIKNIKQAMIDSSMKDAIEVDARRQDGDPFVIELSANLVPTEDGQQYLLNIQDITERRRVAQLKQEFITTINQELSQPLLSIENTLEAIAVGERGELSEAAQKKVLDTSGNLRYMVTLLNGLLNIDRIADNKLELAFKPVSMRSVLRSSVEAVRGIAEKRAITLTVQDDDDTELIADANSLVQVMVNLLSNALKFSPGKSMVTVAVTNQPDHVMVSVTDQGRGIAHDHQARIFERFEQVEKEDSSKKGGTGLGLAICKAIVEQHDGAIGVKSQIGKGSVFWFRLPKSRVEGLTR